MDGLLSIRPRRGLALLAALSLALGSWAAAPPAAEASTPTKILIWPDSGQTPTDGVPFAFTVSIWPDPPGGRCTCYGGTIHFADAKSTVPADYTFNNTNCLFPIMGGDQGWMDTSIIPTQPGSHTLTVTEVGNPSLTGSITFDVQPGPTTHLALTPQGGSSATVGGAKGFVLSALDAYGYPTPSFAETVYFTSSDASAVKPDPVTFTPDDAGQRLVYATFGTAGSRTLTGQAVPSGFVAQATLSVVAAPYFAVEIDATSMAGEYPAYIVCAYNADGTKYANYAGTITYTISDPNPAAELPGNYTFVPANDHGCINVDIYGVKFATAGLQSMTVTDTVNPSFKGTGYTDVIGGAVHDFDLEGVPAAAQAGPLTFTVKVYDEYGNWASTGYVWFVIADDPAETLPAAFTFHASDMGRRQFTATLRTAGASGFVVREAHCDYQLHALLTVYPGPADHLTLAGITSPTGAGMPITTTVAARDAYGNLDPNYHGTVHFTSTDAKAALPANYAFTSGDGGTHTFTSGVTLKTAGKQAVRARDTVTSTITGLASNITVTSGPASAFVVSGLASPRTAGTPGTLGVKAIDAYGNTVTGYTGTVHFTSTDAQALLPLDYTFVPADAGFRAFSGVVLKTAGLQAIRARDTVTSSVTGLQQRITVNPAAAAVLVVSGIADPYTAGVTDAFTVTAKDAYGNTATGYGGTVVFTSTDTAAGLPGAYTFVPADRGVHSFSLTLNTLGEQAVRARDTVTASITGLVKGITVTH